MGGLAQLLPIFLIIAVFYFLLIRPQQKRQRQLQETVASLKNGDRVITNGGIIGVITMVKESTFLIRSADKTILEVLRAHGLDVPSSRETGTCGTCRTKLLAGEADHRDLVLAEHERKDTIMICVSRARSADITIDR